MGTLSDLERIVLPAAGGGTPDAHAPSHYGSGSDPLRGPIALQSGSAVTTPLSIAAFAGQSAALLDVAGHSKSTSLALGATPALTGALRLTNNQSLVWRNAANNADLTVFTVDPANDINLNNQSGLYVRVMFAGVQKFVFMTNTFVIEDNIKISVGTATGTIIASAAGQKLGFWGKAAVVQPSGMPAAATDLATTTALANYLRTMILNTGLSA